MENVINSLEGAEEMEENRYRLGGWLAIVAALLFPAIFITGFIQTIIAERALGYSGPQLGPADGLSIFFTAIGVYVLITFRRFLHERYEYHGIDLLITFSIVWSILMQIVGVGLDGVMLLAWPASKTAYMVISIIFMSIFMLSIGVIDILMGIRLMQSRREFSELLRVFAVLNIVAGILEVSVILSPLALLIVPVHFVIIGLILLREKTEAEFV
ncbi:hypothetical protein H8E52_06840 [bacterium]|nr:hypothetical protein [bacterium]